jgi:hypothetical protein
MGHFALVAGTFFGVFFFGAWHRFRRGYRMVPGTVSGGGCGEVPGTVLGRSCGWCLAPFWVFFEFGVDLS